MAAAAAGVSEPPMVEQVITEFFDKSLHIILESRSPYDSSRNFTRPSPPSSPLVGSQLRDRWFNLALWDCPAALENFDLWRQSNLEPLVIDIVLLQRDNTKNASVGASRIIERWVIKYETSRAGNAIKNSGKKARSSSSHDHSLYRRAYSALTVLFQSLYLVVRLLPAYHLFQGLNSSGRICPLSLSHKISSFVEPFTCAEDAEMKHYAFAPIETLLGGTVGAPSSEHGVRPSASPFPMSSEPHGRLQPRMPTDNSPTAYSHPHNTSSSEKKRNTVNEECYPSPPLSPSPSHSPSSYPRHPFFRYESAPLSIPTVMAGGGGSRLPPSPRRKDKQQCSSQNENLTHSPNDKSIVSKDLVKLSEFQNKKSLQKVLSFGNDDLVYFRGLKIDISDREDQGLSQEVGGSLTRSPDVAIGILMRILQNAPGLRERLLLPGSSAPVPQEPSLQRVVTEEHGSSASSSAGVPSALLQSRTAADALEELNKYKEIRESILNRSKGHPCSTKLLEEKPVDGDPYHTV
ncbi:unnamed protein product [Miscanthus lutarioriparius]|uniref:Autophagy-related protein 13 N-terminal domain-containing protein n=1 Tax=Miscanthus lutarioriparius TaxID=422564 RepID=A0A811QKH2_9POAL|nr:unnamed protein product [Miscanthus lutarioriparius]